MSVGNEGGFLIDETSTSQGWINSPSKARLNQQSLIPVTIKQLLGATSTTGDTFSISLATGSREISQLELVASIRSLKEFSSGHEFTLEDGTGSIIGKCFSSSVPAAQNLQVGQWIHIFGSLRTMKDHRVLNIFSCELVSNYTAITLHFLRVLALVRSKSSNRTFDADCLSPIQKAVLSVYSKSDVPRGIHQQSVIRALSHLYASEQIRDTISWLIAEGYIFETHDPDHAKIIA